MENSISLAEMPAPPPTAAKEAIRSVRGPGAAPLSVPAVAPPAPSSARVISDISRGAGEARSEYAGDGGTARPPVHLPSVALPTVRQPPAKRLAE
eukprot:scaffold28678_cov111-Isochrysis_galbana.AAC.8